MIDEDTTSIVCSYLRIWPRGTRTRVVRVYYPPQVLIIDWFLEIRHKGSRLNPCSPEGFSQTYFPKGGLLQPPLWIINTEGHITLNLLPVYRYGHPLSIDTNISTNH